MASITTLAQDTKTGFVDWIVLSSLGIIQTGATSLTLGKETGLVSGCDDTTSSIAKQGAGIELDDSEGTDTAAGWLTTSCLRVWALNLRSLAALARALCCESRFLQLVMCRNTLDILNSSSQ